MTSPLFLIDSRKVRSCVKAESPCAAFNVVFKDECSIGAFSYIGLGSTIQCTYIGRYCSIAPGVNIGPSEHNISNFSTHPFASGAAGPLYRSSEFLKIKASINRPAPPRPATVIGNDVWIGANVVIRRGVVVGTGAVIGAGSVVVRDVMPYEVVGGVPARHIRYRFDAIVIEELLASQWWLYDLTSLGPDPVDYADVQGVLNRLKILSDSGNLKVLNPIKQTIGSRMDVAAGKEI
ncbi:CatB-related O-acetyltransferase [Methylobacterium sp.]|uniref:CatB-related O-acetyltransferase n=1 Tax=Methylobacterium sp. TaxID=409 RepID=UPI003B58CC26